MTPKEFCDATNACGAGRKFALKYQSMNEVWENCPKVDWLLWITDKTGRPDDRTFRLFAVWCARNTPLPDGRKTGNLITDRAAVNEWIETELERLIQGAEQFEKEGSKPIDN
jgi:hypothetical protein